MTMLTAELCDQLGAAVQFSLGASVPAFFIRVYGWTATQIGYAYGLIFLIDFAEHGESNG